MDPFPPPFPILLLPASGSRKGGVVAVTPLDLSLRGAETKITGKAGGEGKGGGEREREKHLAGKHGWPDWGAAIGGVWGGEVCNECMQRMHAPLDCPQTRSTWGWVGGAQDWNNRQENNA